MELRVIPGQIRWRWCGRCRTYSALEVCLYVTGGQAPAELVGTFTGCLRCDPDLFADDRNTEGG